MKSKTIEHLEMYRKEFNMHEYCKEINRHAEKGECDAHDKDRFYKTLMEATFKAIPSLSKRKWDIDKEYEKIKSDDGAIGELFRSYTVIGMISSWLEHKQIYSFDKDTLEMLMEKDCADLSCEEILALKTPYECFVIENEIAYGNEILDSIIVNKSKCESGDVILSFYGFVKADNEETKIVRLDNVVDKGKTLFDFLDKDASDDAKRFVKRFMNLILYLSQPKVDVIYKKSEKKERKGKSLSNSMPKNFYSVAYDTNEVGCRLGSAIRNYRVVYEKSNKNNSSDVKRVVKPHSRCGHFHHYWTGKGRTDLIVKYVEPTFVLGGNKQAVIHSVKEDK